MRLMVKFLNTALFTLLAAMIVFVTLQVVNRYIFGFSIPWTEELTRAAYILLIFIGSALATYQNNHIRVLTGVQLLPQNVRKVIAVFGALTSALFFIFVSYGNYIYMIVNWDAKFTTVQWLDIGQITAVILAATVLTAILFIGRALTRDEEIEGMERNIQ